MIKLKTIYRTKNGDYIVVLRAILRLSGTSSTPLICGRKLKILTIF